MAPAAGDSEKFSSHGHRPRNREPSRAFLYRIHRFGRHPVASLWIYRSHPGAGSRPRRHPLSPPRAGGVV